MGYLGGKSDKEHLLTWSFCPCRSQACSRREWGRGRTCHTFGSLKRPPFWQRAEQFDKEPSPPQAGLKFHHMGQRPGPASREHWGPPSVPGLPDPTGPSQPCLSQVAWLHGSASVLKRPRALVTGAKQQAMSKGARVGAGVPPKGVGWGRNAGF